jgi:transcriptional regulator with XRE-family HTH domain
VHPTERKLTQPGSLPERLFRLRKTARLNQGQLASDLGWDRTKVSKIETGAQRPSGDDIRAWASAVGQPEAAGELLDLLADVQAVHRTWRGRLRGGGAAVQDDFDRRTLAAKRFRAVSPLVVPGLLQTAGYARAIMTQVQEMWGDIDVDAAVEARMRRQEALYDPSRVFEFVTTEAALRMPPCPPQVMLGQLDRLMSLDLDNVTLGIIPIGVQMPVVPQNGFSLLDDVAITEGHGGEDTLGEQESAVYARVFERLMGGVAVTGNEARRLIAAAAAGLRDGGNDRSG